MPSDPDEIAERAMESGDEDVETFVSKHGQDALIEAAEYAIEYTEGTVTHRIVAREMDLTALEAGIVLDALRGFVDD